MKNNINKNKDKNSNFNKEKMISTRKEIGFSQEDVAELIGVSRQTISAWESGKSLPTIDNITKLANLFKISIEDLTFSSIKTTDTTNQTSTIEPKILTKKKSIKKFIIILIITTILITLIPPIKRGIYYLVLQNKLEETYNINNYYYKIYECRTDKNNKDENTNKTIDSTSVYFKNNIMKQIVQNKFDTVTIWINYKTNERIYDCRI